MDPWADPYGRGYPALACADRVWSRRVVWRGLRRQFEKLFIAEAHTDFVLAVIAEELGSRVSPR